MTAANVIPFPAAGSDGGPVSPFDQFKRVAPDGTEFWSGRDIMGPLGYKEWRRFADAIDRARASMVAQGVSPDGEFSQVTGVVASANPSGTERADVLLTRYAAYLVAMNGDPRKPEVAAAQAYFAIKTREAEVVQHEIPQTYAAALLVAAEQAERADLAEAAAEEAAKIAEAANRQVLAAKPKVEAFDQFIDAGDTVSIREAARWLSNETGVDTGQNRLFAALKREGVLMKDSDVHRGYMPYESHKAWFKVTVKDGYTDPATGEVYLPSTVSRVRREALPKLRDFLIRRGVI